MFRDKFACHQEKTTASFYERVNVMSESAKPMMFTPWQRQDGYIFVYAPVVGLAIRYDRNYRQPGGRRA